MKIVLFGASGNIGRRILDEAVRRGHEVIAAVRDISKVPAEPRVKSVNANVLDPESVERTVRGADVVISAFAPVAPQPAESVVESVRSLHEALTKAGVLRLIVVGGAGSLLNDRGQQVLDAPNFPAAWKGIAMAHRDALQWLQNNAGKLEWTYLSPPALIEPGERTGNFRIGGDKLITDASGVSRLSFEDYAVALVDEIEQPAHIRQRFTAAY